MTAGADSSTSIQGSSDAAPAGGDGATLVIELPGSDHAIETRLLEAGVSLVIGRDAKACDLAIDHPTVSRQHARLWHDATGWHLEDRGSQNGSRVNSQFIRTPTDLQPGDALHLGRVRAWFFGPAGLPDDWRPSHDDAEHAGRLVRCRCGHIGWVPDHTIGMRLPCVQCGRDLLVRERDEGELNPVTPSAAAASAAAAAGVECVACHTSVAATDRLTTCPDCGAQMHVDCWDENRGCATYGCPQVNVLDTSDAPPSADTMAADETLSVGVETRSGIPLPIAQTVLLTLIGLPMFGVPALAYAAFRLAAPSPTEPALKRIGYILATVLGGTCGFITSTWWWLGGVG